MCKTKKIVHRRDAFTLVEMLVVIAIILALAALAAAFAPRVNEDRKRTRAVDNLEQWLLTAKMRAKRDGLATGLRFVLAPGDIAGVSYSQFQYIQQPPPLGGGVCVAPPGPPPPLPGVYQYPAGTGNYYTGGLITSASAGIINFASGSVDFTLGGTPFPNQWLVQAGDYLEINGGGVYQIGLPVSPPLNPAYTLQLAYATVPLSYDQMLSLTTPTTNFRILRQPRILIGEEPLVMPTNYAANFSPIPGSGSLVPGTNVLPGPSGNYEILFSPTGAVIGTNAGTPILWISVWDTTADVTLPDFASHVGIVGIQSRSGFIGAYDVSLSGNPFAFVQLGRESGM